MTRRWPLAALAPVLLWASLAGAALAQDFPALTGRVVDAADILSPQAEQAIDGLSRAHEAATTNQVVVATVPSLQGYEIEDYGYRLGRAWGIGQDGSQATAAGSAQLKDNGVILLVAPNERKVRIEVGYGLEGELTDAVSSVIIQSAILPPFRAGDFDTGIRRGVEDIVTALGGDSSEFLKRVPERVSEGDPLGAIIQMIFIAIFLYFMFSGVMRGRRRRRGPFGRRRSRGRRRGGIVVVPGGGWSGGGGWGGGSSSGGGFSGGFGGGGFSGGGGGFGGGGASGSW